MDSAMSTRSEEKLQSHGGILSQILQSTRSFQEFLRSSPWNDFALRHFYPIYLLKKIKGQEFFPPFESKCSDCCVSLSSRAR